MTAPRTVLITGASGNLGRKARRHLEAAGGFDLRLLCWGAADPGCVTADLAVLDEGWTRHLAGVDTVLHLAAEPSPLAAWPAVTRANVDMTLNVFLAAARAGVRRIVFASSNWVLGGHRFSRARLDSGTPPWPVNAYGASKLFGERLGRAVAEQFGLSVICLRIGYCRPAPNDRPDRSMKFADWGRQMWLSDRDFCQAVERAVTAEAAGFAVVNVVSRNAGMRWDLDEAARVLGYVPADGHALPVRLADRLRRAGARLRDRGLPRLARAVTSPRW